MSKEQAIIELNPVFDDLYNILTSGGFDYSYNIGGRWSGKTFGILQVMILIALIYPGYKWGIFRKVYSSIRDSVFEDLIGILEDMNIPYIWDKRVSPLNVKFSNGSEFKFKGMDSTEKTKGLAKLHGFFMEELNEFTAMDFETIDNGIRGKNHPNIGFMAHNPVPQLPGSLYWFQEMFGSKHERGDVKTEDIEGFGRIVTTKTTFLDNVFCPQKRRDRLEGYKKTNPDLYKLWALGDYAEMRGVIFDGWDVVESVPDGVECIGVGLDFGFSADPAAAVRIWANSTDLWVKGLVYSTGLTNDELYTKLMLSGVDTYDNVVADSAEPKSIEDLYKKGLARIDGVKKKPNYKAEMANVLKGYKIHLIDGDTDLQREFSTWSWDEDKTGKLLPRPKDGNDHYIDAMIMLCHDSFDQYATAVY